MATWLDAAYYTSQGQPAPPFLTAEEEKATITRSVRDKMIGDDNRGKFSTFFQRSPYGIRI